MCLRVDLRSVSVMDSPAKKSRKGRDHRQVSGLGTYLLSWLLAVYLAEVDYRITVKTGEETNAGTDANVYLQMFGENGKTQNFSLREEGDKRRFERGRVDKFLIRTQDVGKVMFIVVSYTVFYLVACTPIPSVQCHHKWPQQWTRPATRARCWRIRGR